MGDEWNGRRNDAPGGAGASPDDLERQAREALALIRERVGDLGSRVRRVMERAGEHWDASAPAQAAGPGLPSVDAERARRLIDRWVSIDFLVDPDLLAGFALHTLEPGAIWRVEVRERGETRTIEERGEPYRGAQAQPTQPTQPILPPWDYTFPLTPEIESGERRERLAGTDMVRACLVCNGTGHRPCHDCDGHGFVTCPQCRGRSRLSCPRCRGRGRVADPVAERRARSGTGYIQVQAERFAVEAGERVADFAERLRQDYGVPLPPAKEWMPVAPASGATIPCPDCVDGTIPCACGNGKRVCATCEGSGHAECQDCKGTGRVVRHRELVRRFDTRLSLRTLPLDERVTSWVPQDVLARGAGDRVWSGGLDAAATLATPSHVPLDTWKAALAFAGAAVVGEAAGESARRIVSRQLALVRLPLARIEYTFAGHQYVVIAFGRPGAERFWAESFPPRWSRVGRFLRALSRDLSELGPPATERPAITERPDGTPVSMLEEYRARRAAENARPPDITAPPPDAKAPDTTVPPPDAEAPDMTASPPERSDK